MLGLRRNEAIPTFPHPVCGRLIAIAGSNLAEGMMFVCCLLCVEYVAAAATSWSLVHSPNARARACVCVCVRVRACVCVIWVPQQCGNLGAILVVATQKNKSMEHHSIWLINHLKRYVLSHKDSTKKNSARIGFTFNTWKLNMKVARIMSDFFFARNTILFCGINGPYCTRNPKKH